VAKNFNKTKWLESLWGYIFILPAVAIITIFWMVPSAGSIYYSFFKFNGIKTPKFIGLENFITFFSDPQGLNSLKVAGYYIIGTLPPAIIIGFILAIIISKKWFKGGGFFSAVYFLPVVMSYIGVSFIWKWVFEPIGGLANYFLRLIGLEGIKWLTTPGLALICILFISVWKNIGFFIILYLAAIRQIPESYVEAAEIDGVNEFQKAIHIIWPLVFPTTIFLTIMSVIDAFRVFDQIYALTFGGPNHTTGIVAFYVWQVGFMETRMGYSSAIASVLLLIMIILTYIQWKFYTSRIQFIE
jgi:multiple sugar transport system permease protein